MLCADHDSMEIRPVNILISPVEEVFSYLNGPEIDADLCYAGCNPLQYNIGVKFPTKIYNVNKEPVLVYYHTRELE